MKCDNETTTQNDVNSGMVNIQVGFAPPKPAEFVVIKIQQLAGQTRFDPYKNFKFRVRWDGRYVAGFSKVSPLEGTTDLVAHREGGDPRTSLKLPDEASMKPSRSSVASRMTRSSCSGRTKPRSRTLFIVAGSPSSRHFAL